MSRFLFFVPLLLLLMCCACEPVCGKRTKKSKGFDIFVPKKTAIPSAGGKTFNFFNSLCLVEAGGMMVAFAEGSDAGGKVDLLEGHIELGGRNLSDVLASQDAHASLRTQIVKTTNHKRRGNRQIDKLTVVSKDSKIFVYFRIPYKSGRVGNTEPVYQLALGEVEGDPKQIKWKELKLLTHTVRGLAKDDKASSLLGDGGSGIVVNDTLVIPVTYKGGTSLTVSGIIYSVKGKHDTEWEFVNNAHSIDCIYPIVVEWEGKLFMMTSCKDGYRKVFESTDMGKRWTEAVGTLSRVWGNSQTRTGFGTRGGLITAKIDSKTVMLFAQPVSLGNTEFGQLRLWMTDGTHIYNVGLISHESENATAGSLLYKDNKLYCLYEVYGNGAHKVVLAELTSEFQRIRYILKLWTTLDKNLSQCCGLDCVGSGNSRGNCDSPIPTTGLVGFLSNQSSRTHWKEVYRCVSAIVSGGTRVPNGLRFEGVGAGAQWPVGRLGQDQRYHFANYAFTLAATVAIHAVPSRDTPVLTAGLGQGADKLLGLLITRDKNWKIATKAASSSALSLSKKWELDRTYHVVLMMRDDYGFLYIDGESVWNDTEQVFFDLLSSGIWQFYIGGNGNNMTGTYTSMTATNVFLYNRALNASEIGALFRNKATIPKPDEEKKSSADSKKLPDIVSETPVTTIPEKASGPPKKLPEQTVGVSIEEETTGGTQSWPVSLTDDANNQLVNYGVTTYLNGRYMRREVQIPRAVLERMKLNHVRSGKERRFLLQTGSVDVTVREHVGGVLFLLLGFWGLGALFGAN